MDSITSFIPERITKFIKNRKKSITYFVGSVGVIYFSSQWILNKINEAAERSSLRSKDEENLIRRFNLNLQDCHFTVLALLPSLSSQILSEMNVEAASAELGILVAKQKREELERSITITPPTPKTIEIGTKTTNLVEDSDSVEEITSNVVDDPDDEPLEAEASEKSESSKPESTTTALSSSSLSLNPAALEFIPSSPSIIITAPSISEADLSESWDQLAESQNVEQKEPVEEVPLRTRAELWNEIKILSFTRTITSIYTLSLITIQTYIQLNLIGQISYSKSVNQALLPLSAIFGERISSKNSSSFELTGEIECMYLTFSWWLLHRGWKLIGDRVRLAVEEVIGPLQLKTTIVYGELSGLLGQIRNKIDYNPDGTLFNFIPVVSPSTLEEEIETLTSGGIAFDSSATIPTPLRFLLDETADIFESDDCSLVQKCLLDSLFNQLSSALEKPFRSMNNSRTLQQGSRFEDITEMTANLASLLPALTRQSHLILNGLPNEYFDNLTEVSELRDFSAIVYTTPATQLL